MFENIIGQEETIDSLKGAILENRLPRSLLFHGPDYSGKLSTALEIVRVLSCRQKGEWNCGCGACEKQRLLIQNNLLILGARDNLTEISASADVLLRTKKPFARYLFIRGVRKQLKAYDPVLWEGDNTKVKSLQPLIFELEEKLNLLHPDLPLPDMKKLEKLLKDIIKTSSKLTEGNKSENIPINQIRRAIYWAHHSIAGTRKFILINSADKMLDSSRNSLLKILEEPPEGVYIILLTSRKGAIIRTLLSRLRPYGFKERSPEESGAVLAQIFREENQEFKSLKDYFLAWKDLNPGALRNLAHSFIKHLLESRNPPEDILAEMDELVSSKMPKEAFASFFEELFHIFRSILNSDNAIGLEHIEEWTKLIKEASYNLEFLNIGPKNLLESIYYKMKARL